MHQSEMREFLGAVLGSAAVELDEDGMCSLETEQGVGMTFVFLPPELRVYCSPLAPEEYEAIEDKQAFLEALLAINYESDVGARQEFKMGFHERIRVPLVAAVVPVAALEVEATRSLCEDLLALAQIVRETTVGGDDDAAAPEDEFEDEDEPSAFDGRSLRL